MTISPPAASAVHTPAMPYAQRQQNRLATTALYVALTLSFGFLAFEFAVVLLSYYNELKILPADFSAAIVGLGSLVVRTVLAVASVILGYLGLRGTRHGIKRGRATATAAVTLGFFHLAMVAGNIIRAFTIDAGYYEVDLLTQFLWWT